MFAKANIGLSYLNKRDQDNAMNYFVELISDADKVKDAIKVKSILRFAINELYKILDKHIDGTVEIKSLLEKKVSQLN